MAARFPPNGFGDNPRTTGNAMSHLEIGDAARAVMANNIPVAFAVTYLIGVVGAAWFLA